MTAPRFSRRPASAFTLIELLTVIAIVGILAAIIIPTVGRVRAAARMTTDLSNLRQIGMAAAGFVSENKGAMPNSLNAGGAFQAGEANNTASGGGPGARFPIYESLDRYFTKKAGFNISGQYQWNQRAVWFSSSAVPPDGVTSVSNPYGNYVHFSFNPYIWRNSPSGTNRWRARMSNVPSPSRTVLAAETNDLAGVGDFDLDPTATPATTGNVATTYRVSQPGGKGLYLYADYHVASLAGNQNFTVNPTLWCWW
ncbi:MAG: type II secretion system protein [Burkholderiales bacterium]|nr:type II secretion system protein [Opitutaceae bacterium]